MLKLARRIGEAVVIGDEIRVIIMGADGDVVRVGVQGGVVRRDVQAGNEAHSVFVAESKEVNEDSLANGRVKHA